MHYYNTIYEKARMNPTYTLPTVGFFRFLHAVPDAPNVDLYSYARSISRNIPFGQYIGYVPLVAEPHQISIYPTGTDEHQALTQLITIGTDSITTLAAVGRENNMQFLEISGANQSTDRNQATLRFAHLSPNAPSVDITLPDGTILFGNIGFKQVSPSIPIDPSITELQVRIAGTPNVVLSAPNLQLEPNKAYTLYALGLVGESPELQVLLVREPSLQSLISLEGIETGDENNTAPRGGTTVFPMFSSLYIK